MNERSMKLFWLGLFLIGALVTTAWLLLFLRPSYGDGREEIRVRFTNIEKVSIGTRVTYAGKPVGKVVAIEEVVDAREQPTDQGGNYYFYELVLKVDSSVKIFDSDEILFTTTGLLGEKSIAILPKPPPPGHQASQIQNNVILYANSSEGFEQAITDLKGSFSTTLREVDEFLVDNKKEFHQALLSVTKAADQMTLFLASANEQHLVERATNSLTSMETLLEQAKEHELIYHLSKVSAQFHGEESGSLCCQVRSVLNELHCLINNINNYGLLFQYNRKWQRNRLRDQSCCMEFDENGSDPLFKYR